MTDAVVLAVVIVGLLVGAAFVQLWLQNHR